MNTLKDKVAIITGATRGIGFAIAKEFVKEGARLVLTAHTDIRRLSEFKDALKFTLDLANPQDIEALVSGAMTKCGQVDILVNNAGIFEQKDFLSISQEELRHMFEVNFFGSFSLTQKVLLQMQERKNGKIVNVASGAGILGSSRAAHYASTKAALIALTKSLAKLAGPYGINVNAIAPGFIETDMIKEMISRDKEKLISQVPMGRIGTAGDVAKLALFLASASSDYITGQVICVDGGQCMV